MTNNDLKLIKYLYECEFLTRKQIYDYVLSDITNRQVRNILSKLKSFNFIKYLRNPFQFSNEEYIYVVDYFAESSLMMTGTFKQFKKMCDEFNLNYIDLDKYRMFKTETFNNRTHDYFLNNVRFMLEDIGAKNWIPEYIIRQNDSYKNNKKGHIKKVPDGIIKGTNNIAIELERTLKTPSRYLDIFNKYKKNIREDINLILYVTVGDKSDYIYNGLKRFANPNIREEDVYLKEMKFNNVELTKTFYKKYFLIKYDDLKNGNFIIKNTYSDKEYYLPDII